MEIQFAIAGAGAAFFAVIIGFAIRGWVHDVAISAASKATFELTNGDWRFEQAVKTALKNIEDKN